MIRMLRAVCLAGALFAVLGCNEEVKEIPAADKDSGSQISEAERKKELDAEAEREKKALENQNAIKNKKASKKTKK